MLRRQANLLELEGISSDLKRKRKKDQQQKKVQRYVKISDILK